MHGLNWQDYGARWLDNVRMQWTSVDPLAEKYYGVSPYAYCNDNSVRLIDPNGLFWKPTMNEKTGEQTGYEWVDPKDAYNNDGTLKDGLYDQAIFFSDNGTYNPDNDYNIGSSTATVYNEDGTKDEYQACTHPSDEDKYPTIPAGIYTAQVGDHHGSSKKYPALKMRDVDAKSQTIELGAPNPAHHKTTSAIGIDIHMAGNKNATGMYFSKKDHKMHGVSEGCVLIDINQWNQFMNHFDNSDQRENVISITVSRSIAVPTDTNVLLKTITPMSIPTNLIPIQKVDAVRVALPYYH